MTKLSLIEMQKELVDSGLLPPAPKVLDISYAVWWSADVPVTTTYGTFEPRESRTEQGNAELESSPSGDRD